MSSMQSATASTSTPEESSGGDSSPDELQHKEIRPNHKGRRGGARRKFRGGKGGRGRRRQRAAAAALRESMAEEGAPVEFRPWWYAYMEQSGLTPQGMQPTEKDGYPVILPSSQAVYILPSAVNPHRASTYVKYIADNDTTSDISDSASLWKSAFDEKYDFVGLNADRIPEPDILQVARARAVTLDLDDGPIEEKEPELNISFDFIEGCVNDDDISDRSTSFSSSTSVGSI